MNYAAYHKDFVPNIAVKTAARPAGAVRKPGVLRRLHLAMAASRQRQADREITRFLAGSGGRITDDIERQMMQRLMTSSWGGYRRG